MKISRGHDAFKKMKDILKTNLYPNLTTTDDIQVLSIVCEKKLTVELLLYVDDVEYQPQTKKLLEELISISKETYEISKQNYEALALKENHAGIIAAIRIPDFKWKDFETKEFLFILDHLEIPGNIGTIYRTLDAIGADGVILVNPITKFHNPKLTSAARGCNLIIPTLSATYEETLAWLIKNQYDIFLGEPELGMDYQSYSYQGKIAIVVGNERFGIEKDWYNHPHKKVYIPMEGHQNSLNVGVAASILAYEAYMKRK